jgi:hypothetical protein
MSAANLSDYLVNLTSTDLCISFDYWALQIDLYVSRQDRVKPPLGFVHLQNPFL